MVFKLQVALMFFALGVCAGGDPQRPSLRGSHPEVEDFAKANWNLTNSASLAPESAEILSNNETAHSDFELQSFAQGGGGGWHQGGDKMWGSGRGVEDINYGNVDYYDQGMAAARARCGDARCALIVNPPGHRTVQTFHIHFVHFASYGESLKKKLESQVCGKAGWYGGDFPCGGRATFSPDSSGIFRTALSGGSIRGASVIAWPSSCGGRGIIVELAYGCSIEHQIRGDYNPNRR